MPEKSLLEKVKEAATHTVIYGMGSVIQAILGFILIPLYTRFYTTDLYGTFALLQLCATLAGSIFYLGASSALSRSYFDYPEGRDRKKAATTSLAIILTGAFLQILFGILLRHQLSFWLFKSDRYAPHVMLILISSALGFINALFFVILRFQRKSKLVIIMNLLSLVFSASTIFTLLVKAKMGVMAPILGDLINQTILIIVLFLFSKRSFCLGLSRYELKMQLQFGVPAIFASLGYYCLTAIDKLIINRYGSLGDVGIYSLGYKIGTVIHIVFIFPFGQIWAPMRMEYRHDSNARDLYRLILTYYFIAGMIMAAIISVFSHELLRIISGRADYIVAYKVVPIIIIAHLIYGLLGVVDNGLYFARKMYVYSIVFFVSVILNGVINLVFVPRFGYMAAAYGILFTFSIAVLLIYFLSNRLYRIDVEKARIFKILAAGVILILAGNQAVSSSILVSVLIKSLAVIIYVIFLYVFVLNPQEKAKLMSLRA